MGRRVCRYAPTGAALCLSPAGDRGQAVELTAAVLPPETSTPAVFDGVSIPGIAPLSIGAFRGAEKSDPAGVPAPPSRTIGPLFEFGSQALQSLHRHYSRVTICSLSAMERRGDLRRLGPKQ
jgi:hypothetical protein